MLFTFLKKKPATGDFVQWLFEQHAEEIRQKRANGRALFNELMEKGRADGGSSGMKDCLYLYLLVRHFKPRQVFEIGTWVGHSATYLATALRANQNKDSMSMVYTCDTGESRFTPPDDLNIECFRQTKSTDALKQLKDRDIKLDFVFCDGTLQEADIHLLNDLASDNFIFATHDYKAPNEKGIRNVKLMKQLFRNRRHYEWMLPTADPQEQKGYLVETRMRINRSVAVMVPKTCLEAVKAPSKQVAR